MPRRLPLSEVEPFVEEKRPWIERTLRRMREAEAEHPPARLEDGGEVPYLGERLELRCRWSPAARARTSLAAATRCTCSCPARGPRRCATRSSAGTGARRGSRSSLAWTRPPRARAHGTPGSASGASSTRWASCSSSGAMSFNWRLLLAPEEILDYVVEHEVAHLEIHDHSERFWSLLESRCPDYREHERWLRRNGQTLRLP